MIFRQLFDSKSGTYSYLMADKKLRDAVIIDPVKEQLDTYLLLLKQLDIKLINAIDTHTHADHITALGGLREETDCITLMGEQSQAECISRHISDSEIIRIGDIELQAVYTPGHTDESYSFVLDPNSPKAVFTGDVLLIRGTGRTDFQNGDPAASWDSINNKLFKLPEETLVYPAHDYKGWTVSSIREEKLFNPRLAGKTRDEYIDIMNNLNLPNPKLMDIAVPANLTCGL